MRALSRKTLGPETFKFESNSGTSTDFGTEEGWSQVVAGTPGRLAPERSMTEVAAGRVSARRRYVLAVHPAIAAVEGQRVTRISDGSLYRVVGVDGPQTDDAVVKIVRLEKEK